MSRRPVLVVLCGILVMASACGSSGAGKGDRAATPGGGKTITIANFDFAPEVLELKVGDTVTVENKDSAEHTLTATDKSFDTGRFAAGTKTFTVSKAGRFEYACEVHPFMTHRFIQVAG